MHEDLRSHIIQTAAKAFHQQGIKTVTMDDIAHRLTISKRTLYQIFADKEELLLACLVSRSENERRHLETLYESSEHTLDFLLKVFKRQMEDLDGISPRFFTDLIKYPRVIEFFTRNRARQEEDSIIFLNKAKDEGFFRNDVNFRIVIHTLHLAMETMVKTGEIEHYSQREIFENTVIPLFRGCATMKGIELIDRYMKD